LSDRTEGDEKTLGVPERHNENAIDMDVAAAIILSPTTGVVLVTTSVVKCCATGV
jgi:hypothetical protein